MPPKLKALRGGTSPASPTGDVSGGSEAQRRAELELEDEERIREAVNRHLGRVWRVLRRAGLAAADAEDAAQDVFWVLAQRILDVPPNAEFSFLLGTALRVAADRRRTVWNRSVTEPLDASWPSEEPRQDEVLGLREQLGFVDRALAALGADERAVFVLVEIEELTREQAAEILAIPPGTVATRLRRARDEFRRAIVRVERESRRQR